MDGYYGDVADQFTLTDDVEKCDCPIRCPCDYYLVAYDFNIGEYCYYADCGGAATWMWGIPGGEDPPIPVVACDDIPITFLLGTTMGMDYPVSAGHRAILAPVVITEETWCMEMCHFYDIETRYDGGNVKISVDGGITWTIIEPQDGYPYTAYGYAPCIPYEPVFTGHALDSFVRDCFNLYDYIGMEVLIAFDFGSDSSVTYPGWYINEAT